MFAVASMCVIGCNNDDSLLNKQTNKPANDPSVHPFKQFVFRQTKLHIKQCWVHVFQFELLASVLFDWVWLLLLFLSLSLLDQYDMHGKGVNNTRDRKNENNLTTIIRSRQHTDGHTQNPFEHLNGILFLSVGFGKQISQSKSVNCLYLSYSWKVSPYVCSIGKRTQMWNNPFRLKQTEN